MFYKINLFVKRVVRSFKTPIILLEFLKYLHSNEVFNKKDLNPKSYEIY